MEIKYYLLTYYYWASLNPVTQALHAVRLACDSQRQEKLLRIRYWFTCNHIPFEAKTHEAEATTHEAEATTHEAEATTHEAEATTHEAEATTHEAEATTHEAEARFFGLEAEARPWGLTSLPVRDTASQHWKFHIINLCTILKCCSLNFLSLDSTAPPLWIFGQLMLLAYTRLHILLLDRGIYTQCWAWSELLHWKKSGEVKMPQNSDFRGKKLIYMLLSVCFFNWWMCSMRSRGMNCIYVTLRFCNFQNLIF